MRTPIIILCAALCGCTTVSQMQEHEAKITLTSNRSADALEECISLGMAGGGMMYGAPHVFRGEGRRTLSYDSEGVALAAITIINGPPQRIEVRWKGQSVSAKRQERIRACAQG